MIFQQFENDQTNYRDDDHAYPFLELYDPHQNTDEEPLEVNEGEDAELKAEGEDQNVADDEMIPGLQNEFKLSQRLNNAEQQPHVNDDQPEHTGMMNDENLGSM